jgi:hypothetical protein
MRMPLTAGCAPMYGMFALGSDVGTPARNKRPRTSVAAKVLNAYLFLINRATSAVHPV